MKNFIMRWWRAIFRRQPYGPYVSIPRVQSNVKLEVHHGTITKLTITERGPQ